MKAIRTVLFWIHLAIGLSAGLVIGVMSLTGLLLSLEPQILTLAESPPAQPASVTPPLPSWPDAAQLEGVRSITLFQQPGRALLLQQEGGTWRYDPQTQALTESRLRQTFHAIESWHRTLSLEGPRRDTGKAITGAANLLFVILGLSGIWLWWPRRWSLAQLKAISLFRWRLHGQARDFNWHHAAGIWSVVAILTMSTTGLVMSYRWANSLVYRLVGEATPVRSGGPGGPRPAGPLSPPPPLAPILAAVSSTVPNWESITVPLANQPNAPLELTVLQQGVALPAARHTLAIDRTTYRVVRHDQFTDGSPGRRLRAMLRFLHTGQALGLAGQVVAGLGCVAALVLLYTGWALSYRRFSRPAPRKPAVPRPPDDASA